MSRAVLLLTVVLVAGSAHAEEAPPEERAFVELIAPQDPIYVGQVFPLRLRIGYDRAFFEQHAVTLFRQPMDLPVQVTAPWLRETGALVFSRKDASGGARLALNDDIVEATPAADVVRDGRTYAVVELAWRCQASVRGKTELSAALRFAHATRFEEDFVGGRVALDRQDVTVAGASLTLGIQPLPEGPDSFRGAVGRFSIRSEIDKAMVRVGETLRFTLHIEGEGNLGTLQAPPFEEEAGFHVYGTTETTEGDRRTVVYEIAATHADVREVPAMRFVLFEPPPDAQYRMKSTPPIPLLVVPDPNAPVARTPAEPPPADPEEAPVFLWIAIGLLAGLWLGLLVRARGRPAPTQASEDRGATPVAGSRADSTSEGGFVEFLAARLGVSAAAVIAPDLEERLRAAGVPREAAARAARTLEAMVAARYGGAATPEAVDPALLDALEHAFRTRHVPPAHSED